MPKLEAPSRLYVPLIPESGDDFTHEALAKLVGQKVTVVLKGVGTRPRFEYEIQSVTVSRELNVGETYVLSLERMP